MVLSVMIVEDEARFRSSFVAAIERAPDMKLLGAAATFTEGLALLDLSPDVLLVDLQLPDGNGIDLIREASRRLPNCEAVVVTVFGDERHLLDSIEAGATGYLLKDLPPDELVTQIRVLHAGGSPISPVIARRLLSRFSSVELKSAVAPAPKSGEPSVLSEREVNVLSLASKGFNYDEIAGLMQISRHTVQTYVKRSYRKLQVNSKIEALEEARRLRLIEP
jgi:DNA-binding NarL/FixJ family response regulator